MSLLVCVPVRVLVCMSCIHSEQAERCACRCVRMILNAFAIERVSMYNIINVGSTVETVYRVRFMFSVVVVVVWVCAISSCDEHLFGIVVVILCSIIVMNSACVRAICPPAPSTTHRDVIGNAELRTQCFCSVFFPSSVWHEVSNVTAAGPANKQLCLLLFSTSAEDAVCPVLSRAANLNAGF